MRTKLIFPIIILLQEILKFCVEGVVLGAICVLICLFLVHNPWTQLNLFRNIWLLSLSRSRITYSFNFQGAHWLRSLSQYLFEYGLAIPRNNEKTGSSSGYMLIFGANFVQIIHFFIGANMSKGDKMLCMKSCSKYSKYIFLLCVFYVLLTVYNTKVLDYRGKIFFLSNEHDSKFWKHVSCELFISAVVICVLNRI